MTNITVKSNGGDLWNVVAETGEVLLDGLSNREAWRQADILSKEHLNQSQAKSDWAFARKPENPSYGGSHGR